MKITKAFKQAVGLGIIAGARTFMAPAVISHMYSRHPSRYLEHTPFEFMQTISASKVFKVLALGELVGDKLPNAPNRTDFPGLIGRTVAGIWVGASVYKAHRKKAFVGGLIGGASALAATFGCFFLRDALGKKTNIPDPIIGAVEDVMTITAGVILAKGY
ncbi:DUF4126 family protein [Mucilaginibacter glaciei]|uniref:DUF4126 family protein n=1 Tax=Mucilaginibacter glaciei TaxID=2772109 RepID=A0A926NQW6_9SPHI|nr:DUF4126 family protein [Mucilaginibacter glaciei]MBD1392205.1 DUF4126 family protein [Mucilaginibacter glaciei]